jgi:hypothetical protein
MTELLPHVTYSPEGVLTLRRPEPETLGEVSHIWHRSQADLDDFEEYRDRSVDYLSQLSGATVVTSDNKTVLELEVPRVVNLVSRCRDDKAFSPLLRPLASFSSIRRTDAPVGVDQVLPFYNIGRAFSVVTNHFQRWLNQLTLAEGEGEVVAKDCLRAMALPFGETDTTKVENDFYANHTDNASWARAGAFEIFLRRESFGVERINRRKGRPAQERQGNVDWNWLDLGVGSNTGVGVEGSVRAHVRKDAANMNLYRMYSHGLSEHNERLALSLLLGLGSLAHHAAIYEGSQDVFADARWERPHRAIFPDQHSYAL